MLAPGARKRSTSLCGGIASTCVMPHRLMEGVGVVVECRVGCSLCTPRRFIEEYAMVAPSVVARGADIYLSIKNGEGENDARLSEYHGTLAGCCGVGSEHRGFIKHGACFD